MVRMAKEWNCKGNHYSTAFSSRASVHCSQFSNSIHRQKFMSCCMILGLKPSDWIDFKRIQLCENDDYHGVDIVCVEVCYSCLPYFCSLQ